MASLLLQDAPGGNATVTVCHSRTRDIAALRELVLNSFQNMPEVLSTQTVLIFEEATPARP